MQCRVCHNEVGAQSAFCGHCGASIAAAVPGAVPPPAAYAQPPASAAAAAYPPVSTSDGITPNTAAALAYVTVIPAILWLILEPYNKIPLVRFHSFQSIALAVVWFALWIGFIILHMFMLFLPFMHFLFFLVESAVFFGLFIVWLVTILKASKGEWFKLPILGDFALKQAQS
jgi:uncharacterized membrane protein